RTGVEKCPVGGPTVRKEGRIMVRGLGRSLTIATWGVGALLLTGSQGARACTPQYNPAEPSEIVGCCNTNGTLKTAGRNCVNAYITCQEGYCDGTDGGGTNGLNACKEKSDHTWNSANNGDPCNAPNDPCQRGTCGSQSCNGGTPRSTCTDNNICTYDNC